MEEIKRGRKLTVNVKDNKNYYNPVPNSSSSPAYQS